MKYDAGYITHYVLDYDPGVPKGIFIGSVVAMCGTVLVLSIAKADRPVLVRNTSLVCAGLYALLVLGVTVLSRSSSPESTVILRPFWSYAVLYNRLLAELILNVLLFIPLGFLVGGANIGFLKACAAGCGLSIAIEVTQWLTQRGICNIDDVIHNTIGCALGYGILRLGSFVMTACVR